MNNELILLAIGGAMTIIGYLLSRSIKQVDNAISTLSEHLDVKVNEITKSVNNLKEQVALSEQSIELISREIGDVKNTLMALSTQSTSLKESHSYVRSDLEKHDKRIKELETKVNEMYYVKKEV